MNRLLSIVRETIPYIKELRAIAGSVPASILMQQLDYWFDRYPDGFYKFLEPSLAHEKYQEGDSWTEELGFSSDEFRTAFSKIGKKFTSKGQFDSAEDKFEGAYYCSYHDRIKGLTFYFRNHELVDTTLDQLLSSQNRKRKRRGRSHVNGQSQFTEAGNPNLRESAKPSYVPGECQSPILYTENTSENTTKKEKSASFPSPDEKVSQQPANCGSDLSTNATQEAIKTPHPPTPRSPQSTSNRYKHPGQKVNDLFANHEGDPNPYKSDLEDYALDHIWVGSRANELNAWHPAIIKACQRYLQGLDKKGDRRVDEAAARTYLRNLISDATFSKSLPALAALQERASEAGLYDMATCTAIHRPITESEPAIAQPQISVLPDGFEEWWALAFELGKVKDYFTEGFTQPNILMATGKRYAFGIVQSVLTVKEMKAELEERRNAA